MARSDQFTVGVDFGTLSGRAVVVRVSDGAELGSAVHDYAHGVLDTRLPRARSTLPPDWALQVPSDYVDVLAHAVPEAVRAAGIDPGQVIGLGTDFTACTVLPVLADGTPLCELPEYAERPHAYVKLWKHHAAQPQADRINELAHGRGESWIGRYGGLISSEWEFAKGLQLLEEDPELYARADLFVEAADWIVWQLTGRYVRNACTAGYKGIYQDGRYPDRDFLAALNPGFAGFAEDKLAGEIGQLGDAAGRLTEAAAALTGLPAGTAVAVGNVDAHVTAPAARATEPGQMVAIMGTSTCHVMSHDAPGRGPGHVRGRRRRHRGRQLGLRGRPERGRRHLRLVHAHLRARGLRRGGGTPRASRCTSTSPGWPPSSGWASTGWSPWTGTAATARCWSTTSSAAWSSASPWPPGRRTSTGRCSRRRRSAPG